MSRRAEFLAGDRPDDIAVYVAESAIDDPDRLAQLRVGRRVPGGVVLVIDGDQGRDAVRTAVGVDPMNFAGRAMGADGRVAPDLTAGVCPAAESNDHDDDHDARFVFAFVQEQTDDVDGPYTEGAVVHAYAQCDCGTAYSEKWLVGEKTVPED